MQVVGYDTGTPALFVSTSDGLDSVTLESGTDLDYRLENRHCAGTIHDDRHVACENEGAPYCPDHRSTWVCAKCTGTCLKDEMDCFEDHAVYLAAFAPDTFKVGVTREWRLETRLREQGADSGAHIRTFSDGRVAREYEAELASEIPDRIRVPTKIDGLGRRVDAEAWDALLAEFDPLDTYDFDYGVDLREAPVAETIATGTVRGVKGRVLLLDNGGTTYAVDMRDLVGYELAEGGTERALQSSLGSFG
ncbi:DUF2797 domain-containing protein [Haloferax larsenii]|uniref:DUF2797 domain-containing protein n=1 Tax=Haloferax larsenii TaxID=302484 RepID=A0ABY5RAI3_HALLR|nr:DUF2797 domain-containing protein [Haloferax larsenii]UVE49364.1 DUF2797 domain-containing protein [Haloferax larsenii]